MPFTNYVLIIALLYLFIITRFKFTSLKKIIIYHFVMWLGTLIGMTILMYVIESLTVDVGSGRGWGTILTVLYGGPILLFMTVVSAFIAHRKIRTIYR